MTKGKNKLEELAPNVATPTGDYVEEQPTRWNVPPTFDEDGVQVSSGIDTKGKEHPDPVPMSAPVGASQPAPLMDIIHAMVHRAIAPQNDFDIDETEEEANDFVTDDEVPDPTTPYEKVFEPPPTPQTPAAPGAALAPSAASTTPVAPPAAAGVAQTPPPRRLEILERT